MIHMNELNCWHFKGCRDMNELRIRFVKKSSMSGNDR